MKFSMKKEEKYINIKPNKQDIEEILIWLKDEYNDSGIGFYNNKNIIEQSFEDGNSIVFKYKKKTIGLVVWNKHDKIRADIDIFVIHPDYRRRGFGHFYYSEILKYFRCKGLKAIKLFCSPPSSEPFWQKMGLIKLPDCGRTEHKLTYYMILVDKASTNPIYTTDTIELWDVEPYEVKGQVPKWTWYVEIKNGILLYPIIHPYNCNWNLHWSRNGKVIREEKVKYFASNDSELYFYPFIYIDGLKE